MNPVLPLLLLNAHVVDVSGPRDVPAILIEDGVIQRMGAAPASLDGYEVLDVSGLTVMPGLVDAHVHLSMDPSGFFRDDDDATIEAFREMYLRSYLAWGVTTVVDTGILPDDWRAFQTLAERVPGPDIHVLGPLLSPTDGYVSVVLPQFPGSSTPDDIRQQMALWDDLPRVGVKVTEESGFGPKIWPLHSEEVRATIVEEAQKRSLPLWVHAQNAEEHLAALESYQPRAVVHSLDKPSRKVAKAYAEANDNLGHTTYMVTTMAIIDVNLIEFNTGRLDDPMLMLTVPPIQLEMARNPEIWSGFKHEVTGHVLPDAPDWLANAAENAAAKEKPLHKRLAKNQKAVKQLHDAGVPMVLGSDSGNWPVFPFEFHGPTTLRELELLVDAGLTEQEAIIAGTFHATALLGIGSTHGSVNEGMAADLRIVRGDPLADIADARAVVWTIKDGEARTPRGWMEGGPLR